MSVSRCKVVGVCVVVCKVQQCIQLLSRAKKPVMLIGSQATLPPCPVNKLATAIEVRIFDYYFLTWDKVLGV